MLRNYYFILETVVGFVLLLVLNTLLFNSAPAYAGVHPHPYWIVILLVASRYGTLQGLFAGITAAFFYIFLNFNSDIFSNSTFPYGRYVLPFLFVLVGGVIGEIRNMYKKRHEVLQDKYDETSNDLEELGLQHAALKESKHELDKRIVFQSTTMLNLFERLNSLEILEPKSLFSKIPQLINEQLNAEISSVYLIKNNKLKLHTRCGQNEGTKIPDSVELTDGMMGEVVKSKKVIAINRMLKEKEHAKFAKHDLIICAPITRKDESILGVINIEKIRFFDFNDNTLRVFQMFSHWFSVVIDKALQFQQLKDRNIADEITGAYNYLYLQNRLKYEIGRSQRFKQPLSLVLLEVEKFDQMEDGERKNVLVVLNWIFSNILREIDIITKYKNDSTFAIILPGQRSNQTALIIRRLHSEIDKYQLKPFGDNEDILKLNFGTSTLQLSEGSYETLVASAEARLRFGRAQSETEIFDDLQYLMLENNENFTKVQKN